MPLLSPGTDYKKIPKRYRENLEYREYMLQRCNASRRFRNSMIEMCKHDYLYRICTWVWQHNPDAEGDEYKVGPFITYKFQDKAFRRILDAIENRRDLCIEKSRDMGASWLCILALESIWNALPNENLAFVSRDLDSVSDDTTNSLFGKIDFYHNRMPEWLVPERHKTKGLLSNDANGSKIIAEASTGKALVGSRVFVALVDEYSQIDAAEKVDGFTADATKCRIFNFTHTGISTAAYKLTERADVLKLIMHWSEHPEKARGLYRSGTTINDVEILDKNYHFPPQCPICKSYRDPYHSTGKHREEKPTHCHGVPAEPFTFVLGGEPGGKFPGLRSPWYDEEEVRRCSKRYMAMNLDIDPKGSSDQYFDSMRIRVLKTTYARDPVWSGDLTYDLHTGEPQRLEFRDKGLVKLWIHPEHDGTVEPAPYVISADVGEGVGNTPSCITVSNSRTWQKVLEYANARIEPTDLAPLFVALAKHFKDENGSGALAVWECPGPGEHLGRKVIELGYRNFYYDKPKNKGIWDRPTEKPGFYASKVNKRWLMETYRSELQSHRFDNPSADALEECLNWKYNVQGEPEHPKMKVDPGDPSGTGINHGDQTVADALSVMLCLELGDGPQHEVKKKKEQEKVPYMSLAWRREQIKKSESAGRSPLRV